MAKPKRTPAEIQRARAEGVAKRRNKETEAKAPLLAWAGLTPKVTADDVLERRRKMQEQAFWDSTAMAESHARWSAEADWLRYVVWSIVEPEVFGRVAEWADHVRGPIYCRLTAWRHASERALTGQDPLPATATTTPSGCWPDLRRAINAGRFSEVAAEHRSVASSSGRGCHRRPRPDADPGRVRAAGRCRRASRSERAPARRLPRDKAVAAWVRSRRLTEAEAWPAEDFGSWPSCGPRRNRAMLEGGEADLFGTPARPRADLLVAFAGGDGTANCRHAALKLGVEVIGIEPALEPRPWNRHHGEAPGPSVYVGRGSPLGNPFRVEFEDGETRATAAPRILGLYRRWLAERILPGPKRDTAVVQALEQLTPDHYVTCSCWPHHCHAEIVIRAWRWLRAAERRDGRAGTSAP